MAIIGQCPFIRQSIIEWIVYIGRQRHIDIMAYRIGRSHKRRYRIIYRYGVATRIVLVEDKGQILYVGNDLASAR